MDDLEFLRNSDNWPNWPVCPVKRPSKEGFPDCGVVFPNKTEVVILNLFQGWTPTEFDKAKRHSYGSLEELVGDGWIVD